VLWLVGDLGGVDYAPALGTDLKAHASGLWSLEPASQQCHSKKRLILGVTLIQVWHVVGVLVVCGWALDSDIAVG